MSTAATWVKFFTNAGLPSQESASYAHIFATNRIQMDMLMDINKEYLREMNITIMGDIIAILRHAKIVYDQNTREKVFAIQTNEVKIATVNPVSDRKSEVEVPEKINRTAKSVRRVFTNEDDNKIKSAKTMRIEKDSDEGTVNLNKSTIFTRLSEAESRNIKAKSDIPSVVVTSNTFKSVFNRLGGKQDVDSKAENNDNYEIIGNPIKKTILPAKNEAKTQKVILVQRVPAKAIFHEESTSSSSSTISDSKSLREKSVSFSEKDEILEIQRYGHPKTANIKNRLGARKFNSSDIRILPSTKSRTVNMKSTKSLAKMPSATKMKSDILMAERHVPIQKRLTLRKDKSKAGKNFVAASSINKDQMKSSSSVFKRIG